MYSLAMTVIAAIAFTFASSPLHAQGCQPCPDDRDSTTNCAEVLLERVTQLPDPVCYQLIVFNNQYSPSSSALCNQYNNSRFITIEFLNNDCYEGISINITPKNAGKFVVSSDTLRPSGYSAFSHPDKIIFENVGDDPLARCTADTFDVCIGCADSLHMPGCALDGFDWKVYYSDSNGVSTCVNESGVNGRNFDQIKPRVLYCPENDPSCGCPTYASACNTWSVTYGCDYVDIMLVNDHGYPNCGSLIAIDFMVHGAHRCHQAPRPTFRDWSSVEVFDTANNRMHYQFYPLGTNPGLAPCDTFKMRIPFCCPDGGEYITVQPGPGFCPHYTLVNNGRQPGVIHKYEEPFECTDCYLDKDVATYKAKGGGASPGQPFCDTLVIYNRNKSGGCGTDPNGNTPIEQIDLQTAGCGSVTVLGPWSVNTLGGGAYRLTYTGGNPLQPCDSVVILLCNCSFSGTVRWTTRDENGNILTRDRTGGFTKMPAAPAPARYDGSSSTLGAATPNPASGRVVLPLNVGPLAGDATALVRVYDMAGKLRAELQQNTRPNTTVAIELDGSGWNNGTYVVQVELDGSAMTQTFVLQK